MADFCKQCSIDVFGKDFGELAGQTTQENWDKGLAASDICEGCGPIQVDPEGNCVSNCCLGDMPGHNLPWKAVAEPVCKPEGDACDSL